jgi:hypothetical protein
MHGGNLQICGTRSEKKVKKEEVMEKTDRHFDILSKN